MSTSKNISSEGVLVALDEHFEWLLPWWWARYCATNTRPVCFIDLGLSHFGKAYCEQRGERKTLRMDPLLAPVSNSHKWEKVFGKAFYTHRSSWYKKPFALLQTPFEKTLWVDIDCEILRDLSPLFEREGEFWIGRESDPICEHEAELNLIQKDETLYNSGVIFYRKGFDLIKDWAEQVAKEGEGFCSDQHVLSHLIHQGKYNICELEPDYNWRMAWGLNIHASIVHWVGTWGKEYIRLHSGIGDELAALPPF